MTKFHVLELKLIFNETFKFFKININRWKNKSDNSQKRNLPFKEISIDTEDATLLKFSRW